MKYIKEHKTALIIGIACLVLAVLVFIAVYSMFNPSNSKSIYGGRLDNEVSVETSEVDKIKSELEASGIVDTVNYNKSIRILKFTVNVKDDTKLKDSYKLGDIILNNFSEEVLSYYDIQLSITSNGDDYPLMGYRSKIAKEFTWTANRGEVSE